MMVRLSGKHTLTNDRTHDRRPRRIPFGPLLLVGCILLVASSAHAQAPAPRDGKAKSDDNAKRVLLDRVVAVVNNRVILHSELELRVLPLAAELANIPDERERERRRGKLIGQILDEMIENELIVQAANEAQLRVEPKEIQAALDEIKKQNNLDDAGLAQALAMQGYSISSYKKDVERQIVRMRAANILVRPRVSVTDEDVRARYDEMARRSSSVSKVYLKQVLVRVPSNPSASQLEQARSKAAKVIEKARAGEDFATLAQQFSDDQATAAGGGDLGWIERGSLPTEWEVVVFSMNKGEVRGPINGPSGLHVFFVSDVEKTDLQAFDKLKGQLRSELFQKEMSKQTRLWVDELRRKAHIERML